MNKIKLFTFAVLALSLAVLATGVLSGLYDNNMKGSLWVASGLKPGSEVVFVATKEDDQQIINDITVDERGVATLSKNHFSDNHQSFVSYRFIISRDDNLEPLNVLLDLDKETGDVVFSGGGLDQYADVTLEQNGEVLETRADWAGVFRDLEMNLPKSSKTSEEKTFRLSMNGLGWFSGLGNEPSNQIVEIQLFGPPGAGGGPSSSAVNEISVSGCAGSPPLSICDSTTVEKAIKDLVTNYVGGLMLVTEQLSAVAMQQTMIIGAFFDAKHQLETQRDLQAMQASAHKDYYPSDQMCRFGSFMRSIAHTESKADFDKLAINDFLMNRYLNKEDTAASEGSLLDLNTQLSVYRDSYCDPTDNGGALTKFCKSSVADSERLNKDIDFTRTVATQLTLDVDFRIDGGPEEQKSEIDILALAQNLYSPVALEPSVNEDILDAPEEYVEVRRLAAFQNIAHSSFVNYISSKTKAPADLDENSGGAFMKTLLRDFGLSDPDIVNILGENPSYYAQMDVLTKKIYQDPNFYTNLYDKPVNVERVGVSMRAIALMNARDQYESALRKEMLLSMLVEDALRDRTESAMAATYSGLALPNSF